MADRNQTMSPFTEKEPSPSTPAKMTDPVSRNELIRRFVEATDETTPDADEYLTRSNWNKSKSLEEFLEDRRSWSSGSKELDPIKEAAEALLAVSQRNVEGGSSVCKSAETVPRVIDWNRLPRPRKEQSKLNDKLIDAFVGLVGGVTRENAMALLKVWNWDVGLAVNDFFDNPSHGVFSDDETLAVMEMNWQENKGFQGHLKQGEIGNSSCAAPTKTGMPFNEAGLGNVHVAVSGIATSQVIEKWNSEAVDEDPSIETGPDLLATQERSTITFQVLLADGRNGAEEFMTFRSEQTLRDIRNRIAELRPDDNREYYLTSVDGGDTYDDLDTTVKRIYCRGATKLVQILSD